MTGRRHRKSSKNRGEWDGNISELALVGKGGTGFVFAIDKARVVKIPAGSDISIRAFKREREAFRILGQQGQNQFLLTCLDYHLPDRLVLERCESTVRERLQQQASGCSNASPRWQNPTFMQSSIAWACQAAQGLSFVHSKNIVHADVGCHNMLLDIHGNVKISDFSGSGMLTEKKGYLPALVTYNERSRKPGMSEANKETDIFALGSAFYELATGHLPYFDLPDSQVRSLFARQKWPSDLESIKPAFPAMRNAILNCWGGTRKFVKGITDGLRSDAIQNDVGHKPDLHPQSMCSTLITFSDGWKCSPDTGSFEEKSYVVPEASQKKRKSKKKKQDGPMVVWLRCFFKSSMSEHHPSLSSIVHLPPRPTAQAHSQRPHTERR